MYSFGFIVHPISIGNIHRFFPPSRIVPESLVKKALLRVAPFTIDHIKGIRSKTGVEIEGYFIVCPLFSKQILELDEQLVLHKVLAAAGIAKKLNVNMLGLGALAGTVGAGGRLIGESIGLPVTNGTTYAACAVMETIQKAAEIKNLRSENARVAIVGATNAIGKICASVFSKKVAQLALVAKNQERLTELVVLLKNGSSAVIENSGTDVGKALKDADVVIFTTTAVEVLPEVNIWNLKTGAIICDIPVPRNIPQSAVRRRPDLLVIDGAAIEPPCNIRLKMDLGLAPDQIYACMAETMILTMEKRFENFSFGWEPSLEKVDEISALAHKHGFKPAFTSFGRRIL